MARDSIAAGRLDGTLSGSGVSAGGGCVAHGHAVVIEVDHRPRPLLFPDHTPRDQTGLFPPHEGRSRPGH